MNPRTLLFLAGGGALAYYLFRDQISFAFGQNTAATPPAAPETSNTPAPPGPTLREQLAAATRGDAFFAGGAANYDHWTYYYNRTAQGIAKPAPAFEAARPGADRAEAINLDQFLAALQSTGTLSGFVRRRAWGRV